MTTSDKAFEYAAQLIRDGYSLDEAMERTLEKFILSPRSIADLKEKLLPLETERLPIRQEALDIARAYFEGWLQNVLGDAKQVVKIFVSDITDKEAEDVIRIALKQVVDEFQLTRNN